MLVLTFTFCGKSGISCFAEIKNRPPIYIVLASLLIGWTVCKLSVENNVYYPINIGAQSFQVHVPFYVGNMFHGLAFYTLGAWLKKSNLIDTYLFWHCAFLW